MASQGGKSPNLWCKKGLVLMIDNLQQLLHLL